MTMKGTMKTTREEMTMDVMRLKGMTMNTMIKTALEETVTQAMNNKALLKKANKLDKKLSMARLRTGRGSPPGSGDPE